MSPRCGCCFCRSRLYGLVSGIIRLLYRLGLKRAWRAPVPVVVVGNLTAGERKTPVVIWLVEQLQTRHPPRRGVARLRQSGALSTAPVAGHDDRRGGDEPVLIYQRTGAPVAVSPVRSDAVQALLAEHDVQIIITDDGLQHYALARDKDCGH